MEELEFKNFVREQGSFPEEVNISRNKAYISEIERLFSRIPVMSYFQLKKYLRAVFGPNSFRGDVDFAVKEYLRRGILMSDGTYLFTKRIFDIAFHQQFRFNDLNYSSYIRVKEKLEMRSYFRELMNCFDFVLETLPYSDDFIVCEGIFPIMYIDKQKNMLIQICCVDFENVMPFNAMLKSGYCDFSEEQKEHVSRIAIVDDKKTAEALGNYGFSAVVSFRKDLPELPMTVLSSRIESRWNC